MGQEKVCAAQGLTGGATGNGTRKSVLMPSIAQNSQAAQFDSTKSDFSEFLRWEAVANNTIDFKTIYVDIAGDLIAGLMLSQIIYWHLPNKKGETKLRVSHAGHLWLVKSRADWWEECRISPKQVDRALDKLRKLGLVETCRRRFKNAPVTHIRLIRERFMELWHKTLETIPAALCPELPQDVISPKGKKEADLEPELPQRVNSELPQRVNSELPQRVKTSSETTFAETTDKDHIPEGGGASAPRPDVTPPPKKPRTPVQEAMDAMRFAVAELCFCAGASARFELLPVEEQTNIRRAADAWRKADFTPADVEAFGAWWARYDWRGMQGERPSIRQFKAEWPKFLAWRERSAPYPMPEPDPDLRPLPPPPPDVDLIVQEPACPGSHFSLAQAWQALRGQIKLQMGEAAYSQTLGLARLIGRQNGAALVWVPNRATLLALMALNENLTRQLSDIAGAPVAMQFVTDVQR